MAPCIPCHSTRPTRCCITTRTCSALPGLDPDAPPATFGRDGRICQALQADEVAGVALPIDCSLFEFNMVNIGKEIVDNGNGRTARATRAVFSENGGGLEVFEAYNELYQTGATSDFGSDSLQAFMGQKTAMTISSSALISTVAKTVGENFEVGVAPMPLIDPQTDCGIPVGGGTCGWPTRASRKRNGRPLSS